MAFLINCEQNTVYENIMSNLTAENVQELIHSLGLEIINTWYDGNQSRPVFDCVPFEDKMVPDKTICVWVEPPYEAKIWLKTANPRNNGLVEDITSLETLQNELADLMNNPPVDQEQEYGKYIDRAMMDHYDMMNGDIGDIDFQCDMRTIQNNTSQHILTESIADASFQYTATVSSRYPNDNARVYIYTYSDNCDLLDDIGTYFSSKCNDNYKYILSDNPHIRIEDLRGVYDDPTDWYYSLHNKPYVYAEIVVSTTDDTPKEQIKLLALNAFKRFVETAIQAKSANNTPYMRILDDDPRQFAMDSVGFTSAVKSICEKAGMHALAEAITSLYKACHPVMEAVDVPMQIFADYLNQNNITELDNDKIGLIINKLIRGKRITQEEGSEIYNTMMKRINQFENAAKPTVTESTDDDDDDDQYDEEFGPVNSGNENSCTCMICGKPCGIGSFRGGSVVCPDCEDRRWNR